MAKLASVIACTHNPNIFWAGNGAPELDRQRTFAAFDEIKKGWDSAAVDTLIIVANDHLNTFFFDKMPAFCVGVSEKTTGPFPREHERGIPKYEVNVDYQLAKDLLEEGLSRNFDFAYAQEYRVDHAFIVPLHFITPSMETPIVPIFVNCVCPPLPTSSRAMQLGRVLRQIIDDRPHDERIGIMATGNISIDVGGPLIDEYDKQYESQVMELLSRGAMDDLIKLCTTEKMLSAGNASGEMLNWITVLSTVNGKAPDTLKLIEAEGWGDMPFASWTV